MGLRRDEGAFRVRNGRRIEDLRKEGGVERGERVYNPELYR
jgi:hypothetical protein